MKVIIVTGTPGTGKTTLSKKLAKKLDFGYLDVNETIKKYNLSEGYDKKRKTKIIDVKKLNMALIKEINNYNNSIKKISMTKSNKRIKYTRKSKIFGVLKISDFHDNKIKSIKNKKNNRNIKNGIIIDSHLSHYLPERYVDLCIVTKCGLKELKRRLKKKKYSESKIRENLDAEIFDVCLNEAEENKHNLIVINTTKGINITSFAKKLVI
ncbi:MAG: AAA family ATPase [Nanoarchaeota archaeon]